VRTFSVPSDAIVQALVLTHRRFAGVFIISDDNKFAPQAFDHTFSMRTDTLRLTIL